MTKTPLIFPLLLILLSSAIVPYSYASVDSEAQEDIVAGCRDGQTMVYRSTHHDFICVEPSTANRWVELGMAEIISESSDSESEFAEIEDAESEQFPGAPPPAPKPTVKDSSDNSTCRDGNILVYHFAYRDTICTSFSTATTWERIGLVEIVGNTQKDESSVGIIYETYSEVVSEEVVSEVVSESEEIDSTPSEVYSDDFPKISRIVDQIWLVEGLDGTKSILIEGDSGIIAIDMLSSYESTKKIIQEFKTISDKSVKSIIFTTINPDLVFSAEAYLEEGDVNIIIYDELLEDYVHNYGLDLPNAFTFSSEFLIDTHDVKMSLISNESVTSDQTYIFLPDYNGVLVGDSVFGITPFVFNMDKLEDFTE